VELTVHTNQMRGKLDQTKKEVQQIRALESQLRWDLQREERRQTQEEKLEEARQIMEWREAQVAGMREYVEEKTHEQRVKDLMESKEFQEFKREWKQATRQDEMDRAKVQLEEDMDQARWQADLQRAAMADRQAANLERFDDLKEVREIKQNEQFREKVQEEDDRAQEIHLAVAHQVSQMSAEKEELLRSLQMLRGRQKLPVCSAGKARAPKQRALAGGS